MFYIKLFFRSTTGRCILGLIASWYVGLGFCKWVMPVLYSQTVDGFGKNLITLVIGMVLLVVAFIAFVFIVNIYEKILEDLKATANMIKNEEDASKEETP